MFCSSCGAENKDTAKFCGKCGSKMVSVPPESSPAGFVSGTAPAAGAAMPAAAGGGSSMLGLKIGISAATLVIPLVGLIMGVIYWRDPDAKKKSLGKLWFFLGVAMSLVWTASSGL